MAGRAGPSSLARRAIRLSSTMAFTFPPANLCSRRYQISITAPESVIEAATETFRSLRRLRDVVAAGHDNNSAEYKAEKAQYEAGLESLIRVMRGDLDPVAGQCKASGQLEDSCRSDRGP
jgi:hypothetical protein